MFGVALYPLYLGLKVWQTRAAKSGAKKELDKGRYCNQYLLVNNTSPSSLDQLKTVIIIKINCSNWIGLGMCA